jgi:cytochrome c oxidase subunit 2
MTTMTNESRTSRRTWLGRLAGLWMVALPQPPEPEPAGRRTLAITARKFQFDPEVIDVRRNDVVRLTITSADIDHSFTIDAYRIQKRIPAGGSVTFEFRADEVGRFPFYCSMRLDPGCADMSGELIVR